MIDDLSFDRLILFVINAGKWCLMVGGVRRMVFGYNLGVWRRFHVEILAVVGGSGNGLQVGCEVFMFEAVGLIIGQIWLFVNLLVLI